MGANEQTILIYDASKENNAVREAITFLGNSILRNLTYIYKPCENSAENYRKAIFFGAGYGQVENIFFRISGTSKSSYLYYTFPDRLKIKNCTFFHDLGENHDSQGSAAADWSNIATDISNGLMTSLSTTKNIQIQKFGTTYNTLSELIQNSKTNQTFITNQAGVYYGDYAWK